MKTNAEVIVIGGGVIGNSAAYYLAKRGMSVIVFALETGVPLSLLEASNPEDPPKTKDPCLV